MLDPVKQTITIPIGQTTHTAIDFTALGSIRLLSLLITAPGTLAETINIDASADGGTTYGRLQTGGTDIALAAGKATMLTDINATNLRLVASVAVSGADRVFKIVGAARA
jgi:hypothetical protein